MKNLNNFDQFVNRHIGPSDEETNEMLKVIGVKTLDDLIDETVPSQIKLKKKLNLNEPLSEFDFIQKLKTTAAKNKVFKSYIGMGYYPTVTPPVIQRNVLENPGWYTQYTPYQAEISQGRLEALLNFQTMIIDLTGMNITNASLLDEGTAAAEAMSMFYSLRKNTQANEFFVSEECFPQTIDVLKTRAVPLGINIIIGDHRTFELTDKIFGLLVQYPADHGAVYDYKELFDKASEKNIYKVVAADLLSLAILIPPGEFGADAAVGSSQRFGVPMGYGGPHAAYFATKEEYKRQLPGRIIGVSKDSHGDLAFRMALQTREQHIRREKATSNICTSQVLLAVIAGMYAVYHGPKGIYNIAERTHELTVLLDKALSLMGFKQMNTFYFDTLKIEFEDGNIQQVDKIRQLSLKAGMNFRYIKNNSIGISLNERTTLTDVNDIIKIFSKASGSSISKKEISSISENI